MDAGLEELANLEFEAPGPPWILGDRGLPLEAPENTLVSFERALRAGADGLYYDLRAAADHEPVVLRDATLGRTSDGHGRLDALAMPELSQLDVGGWFSREFVGEPIPFLDEVLTLGVVEGSEPLHFIELHDGSLLDGLHGLLSGHRRRHCLRVVSPRQDHCLELQAAGIPSVLRVAHAGTSDLAFVRDSGIEGVLVTTPGGWATEAARESWPCQRWVAGVSSSRDLMSVFRSGVQGVITSEVRRARAVRALLALCQDPPPSFPLEVSRLPVASIVGDGSAGEWSGEWRPTLRVANPLAFPVRVTFELRVRRGAFEVVDLPLPEELQAGEQRTWEFGLRGGSWSPGGDPLVCVLFEWGPGPGRAAGRLLLEETLERSRTVRADGIAQRVEMLRESPGVPRATMTLQRRHGYIVAAVENPGGLRDVRALARLEGQTWIGGKSVRVPLPVDFEQRTEGVPFACGFRGRTAGGEEQLRRWCGGLPAEPRTGDPGRLIARPRA